MTDELTERVARAIHDSLNDQLPFDDMLLPIREEFLAAARAAIEAMHSDFPKCKRCGAQGDGILVCAGCYAPVEQQPEPPK